MEEISDSTLILNVEIGELDVCHPRRLKANFIHFLGHLILFGIITFVIFYIPSTRVYFNQYYFINNYIQWSTFSLWILLCITGFLYVSGVTERRKNPFKSRANTYKEFIKICIVCPLVYFLGPIFSLSGSQYYFAINSQIPLVVNCFIYNFFLFCNSILFWCKFYIFGPYYVFEECWR